jgi:hypothetical protein
MIYKTLKYLNSYVFWDIIPCSPFKLENLLLAPCWFRAWVILFSKRRLILNVLNGVMPQKIEIFITIFA